jgi:hypothetical protein
MKTLNYLAVVFCFVVGAVSCETTSINSESDSLIVSNQQDLDLDQAPAQKCVTIKDGMVDMIIKN